MEILLTNDDGPLAPGFCLLRQALAELGEVTVVCPADERSGVSHSITHLMPVRAFPIELPDGSSATAVTGNPVDCVKLAIAELLPEPPDLIVSGCNPGKNAGADVFYSGTVSAAVDGGLYGILSVAVSTSRSNLDRMPDVIRHCMRAIRRILEVDRAGCRVFNVNVPTLSDGEPELALAAQSTAFPPGHYLRQMATRGRVFYWLDSTTGAPPDPEGSDEAALQSGLVAITPIRTDMTDRPALERMRSAASARATEGAGTPD